MTRLRKTLLLSIVFVIALIIRLADLGAAQLWYDESFTSLLSHLPIPQMIQATAGDTHPPLYYLLTWVLVHIAGSSEVTLRLPSVLFGMISIWLTYQIARKLGMSERVQLGILIFMAISPLELHFSQEARMYTMLQAAVLWMVLETFNRRWWWVGVAATITLWTHNYGLFFVPVIGAVAFYNEFMFHPIHLAPLDHDPFYSVDAGFPYHAPGQEHQMGRAILAYLVPMILILPWGFVLLGQMATVSSGYWIEPVNEGGILYSIYMLFWGFAMPQNWQPIAILVTVGVLVYGLWKRPPLTLVWIGLVPLVLAVAISLLWKPILLFRGLIPSAPFLYLIIAQALLDHKPALKLAYAGAMVAPVLVACLYGYYAFGATNKGDILSVINQVRAQWQPGDFIYHVNDGSMVGWEAYAPDLPQVEMPPCAQHDLGSLSPVTRHALGFMAKSLKQLPAGRAWVIWSAGPTSVQCEDDAAQALLGGSQPVILIQNTDLIYSGVWNVSNR